MKVTIIQEWLVTVGGSDKVVKAILDVFSTSRYLYACSKKGSM